MPYVCRTTLAAGTRMLAHAGHEASEDIDRPVHEQAFASSVSAALARNSRNGRAALNTDLTE
jgi:hypothetical protein